MIYLKYHLLSKTFPDNQEAHCSFFLPTYTYSNQPMLGQLFFHQTTWYFVGCRNKG